MKAKRFCLVHTHDGKVDCHLFWAEKTLEELDPGEVAAQINVDFVLSQPGEIIEQLFVGEVCNSNEEVPRYLEPFVK